MVGKVVPFDPNHAAGLERHRLKYLLEDAIWEMYLQVEHKPDREVAVLTPQHK